jgi:hypothetical protein
MGLRWQQKLEGKLSHSGVMACRSILLRILDAAGKEHLIATNPVREVGAPKPRLDPDQVFGHQRRRTLTPEEVGHLLTACRPFYRDHFLIQVGRGPQGRIRARRMGHAFVRQRGLGVAEPGL